VESEDRRVKVKTLRSENFDHKKESVYYTNSLIPAEECTPGDLTRFLAFVPFRQDSGPFRRLIKK
jgi:hypothetical protein